LGRFAAFNHSSFGGTDKPLELIKECLFLGTKDIGTSSSVAGIRVLTLLGPAIALLFTAAFLGVWSRWRSLRYLLWLASTFFLFSTAALSQILLIPRDFGLNAVISCILYTAAVLVFADGLLMRMDLPSDYLLNFAGAFLVIGGVSYFFYVDRNLHARIYILNFGLAALLLRTALKIGRAANTRIDRVLSWTLLVFALQFFPRTILSLGYIGNRRDLAALTQSPFWIWLNFSFIIFTVVLGLMLLAVVVSDIVRTLHQNANTDPLTGLLNRRGFEEFVDRQVLKTRPHVLSLIIFDIDNFKSINDLYGHPGGDVVLTQVASLVQRNIRASDAVARLGGEEFVVLLSNLDRGGVYAFAERLRNEIAHTRFGSDGLSSYTVTASFGVVEFRSGEDLDGAVRRADEMLYTAKRSGKNRTLAS
jgi:diguanylate cyclase (GGDEF)-like protein